MVAPSTDRFKVVLRKGISWVVASAAFPVHRARASLALSAGPDTGVQPPREQEV
jgi:hypothetical protein